MGEVFKRFWINNLPVRVTLGQQGERDATEMAFDVSSWLLKYPEGFFYITYSRPGETKVYKELRSRVNLIGSLLYWKPSRVVLEKEG